MKHPALGRHQKDIGSKHPFVENNHWLPDVFNSVNDLYI